MAKSKAAKAGAAAAAVKENPYVQRLVDDDDLRDNIVQAYESLRDAYGRVSNGKPSKLLDDKKLQKDLREAAHALRDATGALRDGPNRSGGFGRKLMLMIVAGGLALALSEGLRKKVLDALFGAEEEFEYTSNTSPANNSGANSGSSAEGGGSSSTGSSATAASSGSSGSSS